MKKIIVFFILFMLIFIQCNSIVYGVVDYATNTNQEDTYELETEGTKTGEPDIEEPETDEPDEGKSETNENKIVQSKQLNEDSDLPQIISNKTIEEMNVCYKITSGNKQISTINIQNIENKKYLFLPSYVDLNNFNLYFDADECTMVKIQGLGNQSNSKKVEIEVNTPFDLENLFSSTPDKNTYHIKISVDLENSISTMELYIMISKGVSSLYLDIDESQGTIQDMKNSVDKSVSCIGQANIMEENATLEELGSMTIKGRGNSTWIARDKKPYQMKLDSKYNILNMGKSKTWILLANALDTSLIRNALGFDLAKALELPYTVDYRFVDLYMNGEYQGNYILCEKNQINTNRIEINNLEDEVDDLLSAYKKYSGIEYSTLSELVEQGVAQLSDDKKTVVATFGDKNYEIDLTGGYLLEFDNQNDILQMYIANKKVTVKSPENLGSKIEDICYSYIVDYVKDADEAILSGTGYNSEGIHYSDYIDIESFAKMWLVKEYSMDYDACVSLYMYKDKNGKLYAGPVWDFDNAFYLDEKMYNNGDTNYHVIENGGYIVLKESWLTRLMQYSDFINEIKMQYNKYENVFSNFYMSNIATKWFEINKTSSLMDEQVWKNGYRTTHIQKLNNFLNARDNFMKSYIPNLKIQSLILDSGIYMISTSLNENKVLDVSGGSLQSRANIQLWDNADVSNQKFVINYSGNGEYTIRALHSSKVLDVQDGAKDPGANVQQYEDNGTDAQKWYIESTGDGYYYLVSKCNGLYLDVSNGSTNNGTNIQLYTGNATNAQKFKFSYVGKQTIENGTYIISSELNNNKVLDVSDVSNKSGANVQLWDSVNGDNQKFNITYMGNGYYSIEALHSGKVLDIENGSQNNGANVQQYMSNGTDAQRWIISDAGNGYYNIISKRNGLYLDVSGGNTSNGTNIQVYTGNGTNSQKFKFIKVGKKTIEDGIYTIATSLDTNKVLDVSGTDTSSGANIQIWDKANVQNQSFKITYNGKGYYTIKALHSGKTIDVSGGHQTPGTNVQQYEGNGTDAQQWIIEDLGNETYSIISKCNGLYLDISGANTRNGTNVQVYTGNGTKAQKFNFTKIETQTIEDGIYTISSALNNDFVLDVSGASNDLKANVQLWKLANVENQKFNITYMNNGYYRIEAVHSNKVLDVADGSKTNGTNVQQYESNGTDAQQWLIIETDNKYYSIISKCNDLYLEVSGGNAFNGSNIQVYYGNLTNSQKFQLNKIVK